MWSGSEKSMEMPQKPDGSSVLVGFCGIRNRSLSSAGRRDQSKTKGPGDCGPFAVQVTVTPKITIFSEPP
ncbi:hypothetical protein SRB17_06040 [Streptomyces sp. RB17]|nr:hypothetical protein [Streptomyces sp. RB17]